MKFSKYIFDNFFSSITLFGTPVFYSLVVIMLIMVVTFLFLLYRLDQVNFFTILMTR